MRTADDGVANILSTFPAIPASFLRQCVASITIQSNTVGSDDKLDIISILRWAIKETAADVVLGIPLRRPLTLSLLVLQYSLLQSVNKEEEVLNMSRREIFSAIVSVARYIAYNVVDKHSYDSHSSQSGRSVRSDAIDSGGIVESTESCREETCASVIKVESEEDWMRFIYPGTYEFTGQNSKPDSSAVEDGDDMIDICANIRRESVKLLFRIFLHGKN